MANVLEEEYGPTLGPMAQEGTRDSYFPSRLPISICGMTISSTIMCCKTYDAGVYLLYTKSYLLVYSPHFVHSWALAINFKIVPSCSGAISKRIIS